MVIPYKIILASNSPRRKELLAGLDLQFEVRVLQDIDESYPHDLPTLKIAEFISKRRLMHTLKRWLTMSWSLRLIRW